MNIRNLFKTKSNQKFGKRFSNLFLSKLGGIQTYEDGNRLYIKKGYQNNPIVYAITSITAKHGSKAPWVIKSKATDDIVKNTLLDEQLRSISDFIQDLITQYLLTGNGFATFDKSAEDGVTPGKPSNLFILPTEETQIIIGENGRSIAGYRVDFLSNDEEVTASDVLHIKTPNPDFDEDGDWLYGQSPFKPARIPIQTYNTSMDTGLFFLENKGSQKILFNENEEEELSPEAVDHLKQKLRLQAQGAKNAANIPIIDGKLGVIDISAKAKEVLVLEQRMQAAKEICNVINFPVQLIGIDSSTYQNAKESKKALWENVIIPILCEVRTGLNKWLAPLFGKNIYIDFDLTHIDALQEDKLMRGKAIREFAGLVTINEARVMAGLKPMEEGGEEIFVNFTQSVDKGTEDGA